MARPIIRPAYPRKPIGLATRGGGSWGAYNWSVLDGLLANRGITITQLSGTSAGAINAAVIASALANGSLARARNALGSFWLLIAGPDAPEVVRSFFDPLERHWRNSMTTGCSRADSCRRTGRRHSACIRSAKRSLLAS